LSNFPDKQTIEDAAVELGVDASFIEKDWYAVKVIEAIAAFSHPLIMPVFSGGTSLSKGYGLLKRFSEDLDFRAQYISQTPPNRGDRRQFRASILKILKTVDGVSFDEHRLEAGSNFFKLPLTYEAQFEIPSSLRPDLQIEVSYTQPRGEIEARPIGSIISELTGEEADFEIPCLGCLETAADKFSALIWRVIKRDRAAAEDDPAMIRHLHDLYALKDIVDQHYDVFCGLANESFEIDMRSSPRQLEEGLVESGAEALKVLQTDALYRDEYSRFVARVSYADEEEQIGFDEAVSNFESLVRGFQN
jgi:hypothetical protein